MQAFCGISASVPAIIDWYCYRRRYMPVALPSSYYYMIFNLSTRNWTWIIITFSFPFLLATGSSSSSLCILYNFSGSRWFFICSMHMIQELVSTLRHLHACRASASITVPQVLSIMPIFYVAVAYSISARCLWFSVRSNLPWRRLLWWTRTEYWVPQETSFSLPFRVKRSAIAVTFSPHGYMHIQFPTGNHLLKDSY